jgi:glycine/D-amino acid oxidase-like deaminating enzyme
VDVDMTVIGAGPVGLYAAYYAGFRGMRTAIVDSLPEPGGQISALYPEKLIYDIAGSPRSGAGTWSPGWSARRSGSHPSGCSGTRPTGWSGWPTAGCGSPRRPARRSPPPPS